ncbi:MAG: hypothetical protein ACOX1O_01925 [Eggerthellaceae bacterium]
MTLPKTFSDSLIRRLGKACEARKKAGECTGECEHIGWCGACWERAGEPVRDANRSRGKGPSD